jgi:hypothetical protein
MNLLKRIKNKLPYAVILVLSLILIQNQVSAATPTLPPTPLLQSTSSTCGDPSLLSNNMIALKPLTGKLYAKLPSTESAMTVYLYSQPIFGNGCTPLGSAVVQPNTWTYIGEVDDSAPASTIIAQGSSLEAEPYVADLDLLNIPSSTTCTVEGSSCLTKFDGYSGKLQPNIISTDTSQVALYVASPINNSNISSVYYYADGSFIYSANKLLPVNRNYLDGGVHSIQIQVNFKSGESISINQSINMGTDWTGSLLFKSSFYRTKNKVNFFIIIGLIILAIVSLLALARYIYKKRKFKREHGLTKENLDYKDSENDDSGPPMYIG